MRKNKKLQAVVRSNLWFKLKRKEVKESVKKEFKKKSCISKVMDIIDFPFMWVRKLTIPPCEESEYDNLLVIIWPFAGILSCVMIVTLKMPNEWVFMIYLPFAFLWAGCYYFLVEKRRKAPKGYVFIEFVGMICGFIQTYYVSGVLIDLLTMIGVISKLSATYLALTIIAIGNALPDAFLTIKLAGRGKAMMGIIGGYAGQLFGLLIGFGLAMLKKSLTDKSLTKGEIPFPLFSEWKANLLDIVVIFTVLVTLLTTFLYGHF